MDNLLKDIRYAFRTLLRSPGFTSVAVLSLALGIGANTAIFSIISSLLFAPLPVEEPSRLVSIFTTDAKNPGPLPVSHLNFIDYRDKNDVLLGIAAYNFAGVNLNKGDGENRQAFAMIVSGNYFDVLGVKAAFGRTFWPDEDQTPGTHPVVVLSYSSWQRDFGGDPSVVGQTISINRLSFSVVGIAPKDFEGTDIGGGPDFWIPMMMHRELQPELNDFYDGRRGLALLLIGRLKPGVTLSQAQTEMGALASNLEREYPKDNEGRNVRLVSLLQARTDPTGDGELAASSLIMMGLVGIVLLIACANVTNLVLARGTKRAREIAVRIAIGASRARLIRQLTTESLVLSAMGGAIGYVAAYFTRNIIRSLVPFAAGGPNNQTDPPVNWRVYMFAIGVTIISGLVFGLVPAFQSSKPNLIPALKGDVTMPVGKRGFRLNLRKGLVILQVALSCFALITAGLFVRSLQKASEVNPGYTTENIILAGFNLGREGYKEPQGKQFHRLLLERVANIPGVRRVTIARDRPMAGGFMRSVFVEGREPPPGGRGVLVPTNDIGPNYFETLGIPILEGRDIEDTDDEKSPRIVIINEAMARQFWPSEDALNKRFKFFGDTEFRQVVGIARNTKVASLTENQRPLVYIPLRQEYAPQITLHIRTSGDTQGTIAALRSEVQHLDSNLSMLNVQSLSERIGNSLRGQRSQATLLGTAGLLALMLASIGVYGVMAYSVAQRTREIGIRMALGAGRGRVLSMVLAQGGVMISGGLIVGLGAAFGTTRLIANSLFGVTPTDLTTFAATALVLIVVSLLATLIPARRATKVDPLVALRYE